MSASVAGLGGRAYVTMMKKPSPTPYPGVNEILDRLLTEVKRILGDQMVGMYLFGSLANGDFDKHSDIDILFVTDTLISEDLFSKLSEMHKRISACDSPWAIQLEVSYIPREALRLFDPLNNKHPHLDRGPTEELQIKQHDVDWIVQRYILRKRGITISGPDPKTLIAPVSSADLRQAVSKMMHHWFQHFLEDRDRLRSMGYQSYNVLTLCRILYTWEHGEIISKPAAAEWARRSLGEEWAGLIDRAWSGRQTPDLAARPEDIDGTLDLIRYTLEYLSKSKIAPTQ